MTADEARDWDEYLAWTRNADPGQYVETEALAWKRLQTAAMRRRFDAHVRPQLDPPPSLLPGGRGGNSNEQQP